MTQINTEPYRSMQTSGSTEPVWTHKLPWSQMPEDGAKQAAASHAWARDRIGEIAEELGIECEYRRLPAYDISQFPVGEKKHEDELQELKEEAEYQRKIGLETRFDVRLFPRSSSR